ncbi:hypothetical protein CC86DRAFT_401640 [Ophiobolus disseminans]|uniref:Uncharacterized protein n=1 Tax=Ophiobolus disseminans TaxID=1469910 RepID=A0A6A7ADX6_9PLEO|nr:hypothetical protein CC86DRAFT_401640 [Ophiobolus disseminans]
MKDVQNFYKSEDRPYTDILEVPNDEKRVITTRNADTCLLFRLPGELRNMIYTYILQVDDLYVFEVTVDRAVPEYFLMLLGNENARLRHRHPERFALLLVCRQMYSDAALLPFNLNTLAFRSNCFRMLVQYKTTSVQRKAIRSIEIHLEASSPL